MYCRCIPTKALQFCHVRQYHLSVCDQFGDWLAWGAHPSNCVPVFHNTLFSDNIMEDMLCVVWPLCSLPDYYNYQSCLIA